MSNAPQIPWPELPTSAWRETCETLQLWTQIVGKIRLAREPWLNHSWHVVLYVTPRGLRLVERAPGVTVDEILKSTEADRLVEEVAEMPV